MLDPNRDPVGQKRLGKLARQVLDRNVDEAFGDPNAVVRRSTHQEVRDHYADVVDVLKRYGRWDSLCLADYIGVSRQTSYQYGLQPTNRGARIIPADKLDRLREAAVAAIFDSLKQTVAPGLTAESRTWQVFVGMDLRLETYSHLYGEAQAARLGGVCVPHNGNSKPDAELSADDRLCLDWLTWRHAGLVTRADAIHIAGADEHLECRVGCEAHAWRITPTAAQVAALKAVHERGESRRA